MAGEPVNERERRWIQREAADPHIVGTGAAERPERDVLAEAISDGWAEQDPDHVWTDDAGQPFPSVMAPMILAALTARRWRLVPDPEPGERTCQRCGRSNVWSWHAPSPLWNRVMRDPGTGQDIFGIVCPSCFAELAEDKGIGGSIIDGKPRWVWHFTPDGVDVTPMWHDPDGRVWSSEDCLWLDPAAVPAPEPREALDAARLARAFVAHRKKWHVRIVRLPEGRCIEECMPELAAEYAALSPDRPTPP